jgi:ABC-type sugar transport system substrate-binding protein
LVPTAQVSARSRLNVLEVNECASAADEVYACASRLVPKYADDIDFVYVNNSGGAVGAAKALRENGLQPGQNVWMVAADCAGSAGTSPLFAEGSLYSTLALSPTVEGTAVAQVIAQYLASGEVIDETNVISLSADVPEVDLTAPIHKINFADNPVIKTDGDWATPVYGATLAEACQYN